MQNATKALSVDDKTFQIQPEVMEFQAQVPEEPVRCVDAQVQCGDGAPVQDQGKQNDVCTTAECESRGSQTNVSGAISAGGEEEVEPAFVREKWTLVRGLGSVRTALLNIPECKDSWKHCTIVCANHLMCQLYVHSRHKSRRNRPSLVP